MVTRNATPIDYYNYSSGQHGCGRYQVAHHPTGVTLPVCSLQYCLSNKAWQPCYVVRLEETTIMLDCALDLSTLLNFIPLPLVFRFVCRPSCYRLSFFSLSSLSLSRILSIVPSCPRFLTVSTAPVKSNPTYSARTWTTSSPIRPLSCSPPR